jgi:hypothetical protein
MKIDRTDWKIIMFEVQIKAFLFPAIQGPADFDFTWYQIFALHKAEILYNDGVYDVSSLYTNF